MIGKLLLSAALVIPLAAAATAKADDSRDHVGIFNNVHIREGESAGDIVCVFCNVKLDGDVRGDVVTVFGNVDAGPDRTVMGDVVVLFGTLRLGENAHVGGDVAVPAGTIDTAPGVTVSGDRTVFPEAIAAFALLVPFAVLAAIIGCIVLIVRTRRRPRYAPYRI